MKTGPMRSAVLALLALATGCATSGGGAQAPAAAPRPAPALAAGSPPPSGGKLAKAGRPPASETPQLAPRVQRLFDEAVASPEEFRKLKVPIDWEVMERRWRAVLDAGELPEAWFNLGVALEHRQQPDEARAAYQRALRLRPSFRQAAVNLALLEEPTDPRQAAASYQELLRRFPEDPVARVRLAWLYLGAGQLDEAWRLAREALVRDRQAAGAYPVLQRVALERGNPDLAELLALRAQKLDARDQDAEIAAFMGDIQLKRGDEAAAAVQYRKALAQRPDQASARLALLAMAIKSENWGGVAEQARALLQKEPGDARAHLVLGVALRYQGKVDEALAEYDKAERLAGGGLPEVHLARGVALMKLKSACGPAIAELKAYISAAGAMAGSSSAFQLQRECEQIVAVQRQAEEAARQPEGQGSPGQDAAKPAGAAPGGGAAPVPKAAPATPAVPLIRKPAGAPGSPPAAVPESTGSGGDLEPADPT